MAPNSSSLLLILLILLSSGLLTTVSSDFPIKEATINDLKMAFERNQLTSRELVLFYIREIRRLNPTLRGVIELNPDAFLQADQADKERKAGAPRSKNALHGIPILLKDNIATKDKMNTTAGSFALLRSIVPRHAFVVTKLIQAGAVILGKASMTEWAAFRSLQIPNGWCARSGQGKNPYVLSAQTCGSSSGSAISVAANMAAVTLGTETAGSILCPSSANSVVGIKPTVGLTSRDGVIPVSPMHDSVGPICRTVLDAVYVLDEIVGSDYNDNASIEASKYIPIGGYKQFLKPFGLQQKRLGILRYPFLTKEDEVTKDFDGHIQTLRQQGAVVMDDLKITNIDGILDKMASGQIFAFAALFKQALNAYLKGLVASPVRSLDDVIAFNEKFSKLEMMEVFGQNLFKMAQTIQGIGDEVNAALLNLTKLSRDGFEKLMEENKLDAVVTPGVDIVDVLAIGGFPGISVPAGYDSQGRPFGIYIGGLKGSEPKLIEIAYGFEQATKIRKPPSFKP